MKKQKVHGIKMCGIIGYMGKKKAKPILLKGLKKLDYRGYDSCGFAFIHKGKIVWKKTVGRIGDLERASSELFEEPVIGIAHTRWATHGKVNERNAHPQFSCDKKIALVHNGIIENYQSLREILEKEGHKFESETDTEVIAHLIEKFLEKHNIEDAIINSLKLIEGAYALAILYSEVPNKIYVAKKSSPLIIGVGKMENIVASDILAIFPNTRRVIYLEDGEIAELSGNNVRIIDMEKKKITREIINLKWAAEEVEKNGYPKFMLKEIFEQEKTVIRAFSGRLDFKNCNARFGCLRGKEKEMKKIKRIILVGCGTSWHACLVGKYLLEEIAGISCQAEYASEFRYSKPIVDSETLVIFLSQSGETADTLGALREVKKQKAKTLGLVNVVGSSIAREVDSGIYLHAGPEIGVASTKTFTSHLVILYLLAIYFARINKKITKGKARSMLGKLTKIPRKIRKVLKTNMKILEIAKKYFKVKNALYLGRGLQFPIALEGALKLKEISYIHAEGYPAAEMKHGPIALIDKNMPSVFVAPKDRLYKKILSNIEEVKSRKGKIIIITTEDNKEIKKLADEVIYVPKTFEYLMPIITAIPIQLLAYHIAIFRGCDVDKPRNLAKSVTVE